MDALQAGLSRRQAEIRDEAFKAAADFIRRCRANRGCTPQSKTFRNRNRPLEGKARVDIEIVIGVAFV